MVIKTLILIFVILTCSCGDTVSARDCNRPAYCYRVDGASQRICDQDKSVSDIKAGREKDSGHTVVQFEECWDF